MSEVTVSLSQKQQLDSHALLVYHMAVVLIARSVAATEFVEEGVCVVTCGELICMHVYSTVCVYSVCVCVRVLCSVVMSISAALFLQVQPYQLVTELAV